MERSLSPMDRAYYEQKVDGAIKTSRRRRDKECRPALQHVSKPKEQYLADRDAEYESRVKDDLAKASVLRVRGAHRRFRTESPPPKRHRDKGKSSKGRVKCCSHCRPEISIRVERQHNWRVNAWNGLQSWRNNGHKTDADDVEFLCTPCEDSADMRHISVSPQNRGVSLTDYLSQGLDAKKPDLSDWHVI